jgi:carboxyl-terminal processing protease
MKFLACKIIILFLSLNCHNVGAVGAKKNGRDMEDFFEALEMIETQYVEKVDRSKLIDNAINGMLTSLDSYSTFLTADEFSEMKSVTKGEFGGVGAEMKMTKGVLKVVSVYPKGSAYKAGVRVNDIILSIDDVSVTELAPIQVQDRFRGTPGTKLKLTILRENFGSFDLTVVRDIIKIIPVKVDYLEKEQIVYIKLASFNERAAKTLEANLKKLFTAKKKIYGVILDLRDNPGGLLDQAVSVARLFIKEGSIVSVRSRHPNEDVSHNAIGKDMTSGVPMITLINGGSASSSEILAGALKDNKRSIIMGEKSYCKGSVQSVIPFSNSSAIKLTTAEFYTPNGESIESKCIEPDIVINSQQSKVELQLQKATGKSTSQSDYVVQRAIDLLKGLSHVQEKKEE